MEGFSRKTRRKLRAWLVITLISGVVGTLYALLLADLIDYDMQPWDWFWQGTCYGLIVGGMWAGFHYLFTDTRAERAIRWLPFLSSWLVKTALNGLVIGIALLISRALLSPDMFGDPDFVVLFLRDAGVGVAIFLVFMFVIQVRSLVGGRVLANFLLGRYNKPQKEDRVFMFLDLADSTQLAQELGDRGTHALISRFFFDIDFVTVEHGAETHRYIGDQVVVSWPMEKAIEHAACIRCLFAIEDMVAAKEKRYRTKFGLVPGYRIGLHGGTVVAGECGSSKQEIVYFGDTINTTARLEKKSKELGLPFLISDSLLDRIELPDEFVAESFGGVELRGRDRPLDVSTVRRTDSPGGRAAA